MLRSRRLFPLVLATAVLAVAGGAWAQVPGQRAGAGRGGVARGGPVGAPGRGGAAQPERPLVAQFDRDKDGQLNAEERQSAYEFQLENPMGRGSRGGGTAEPGQRLTPQQVDTYPESVGIYDPSALRTFFIEFEDANWERMMAAFNNTDVLMPATVTVDGKVYRDVGIHFRGQSSFNQVPEGMKRSLNLETDWKHDGQSIGGYRTFNLLNANGDPTMLRSILYFHIAGHYIPAPKANLARVVINGENWGLYANVQQFNKEMVKDRYGTTKGARWKVQHGGGAQAGGWTYRGDDPDNYRQIYVIKSKDDPADWKAFIEVLRLLNTVAPEGLESALAGRLDVDGALKFLALENVFQNADGFWIKAADYAILRDDKGVFHVLPHDANETFLPTGGRGGRGGPGGNGAAPAAGFGLSPLVIANDFNRPLAQKLLAVPALRVRYLSYVRALSARWLDWKAVGPVVAQYRGLMAADVARDTKRRFSFEEFTRGTSDNPMTGAGVVPLKTFLENRRLFLTDFLAKNPR